MSVIWYVLWYIVAVGFLVIVHEFGHFWVARRLGFKVLRFSIGFGTPLLRKEVGRDRTEIVLAPIPMGGYVKMLDEREGPVPPEDLPRSYMRRPPWQRILVLLAGPGFNILFAILVLWGMLWVNGTTSVRAVVSEVTASSPAASAGLASGDEITAIDSKPISDQRDVLFGLLDSVLSHGSTRLTVRAPDGANRTVTLVTDPAQRKRLAELSNLLGVLGFEMQGYVTPPVIGKVLPNSPAARAGLRSGDRVLAVDDRRVRDFTDMLRYMPTIPGKTITVRYTRDGVEHTAQIAVAKLENGGTTYVGIGASSLTPAHFPPGLVVHHTFSPPGALVAAADEAWDLTAV
ncbi:MAG TPA: RIP metalloprotease RseP, partial [Steroidobacteraceae bacterium]